MLNEYEKNKYEIILKLVSKEITTKDAMKLLNLKERQIYNLKKIYKNEGENGFVHGNRGKINPKKKDQEIINQIENLYLEEYYDYNFIQFYEEAIIENYNISYDAMLKAFIKDDIISPLAHKKTINKYKEKMNSISKEENNEVDDKDKKVELYKSRIIAVEKAHTRRANNLYVFGQEVQMDACENFWFGDIVSYLHLAVDKATKKVLFGWFEWQEVTRGYFVLLFHILINYGIPAKIKADNRSTFTANNAKDKQKSLTQFGTICKELNIVLETTSVPTAKANVERTNGTFKNRLISELRHKGITDIDEANKYLNETFIPKINKKFSYAIDKKKSLMRENTYSVEELKLIISEKREKIIDNASSIYYNYKYYVPINPETGEVINYAKGTQCILIIDYDGNLWGKIDNRYYKMLELENRDTIMKKESEVPKIKKEHQKFIPPEGHPWRKNMMLKH